MVRHTLSIDRTFGTWDFRWTLIWVVSGFLTAFSGIAPAQTGPQLEAAKTSAEGGEVVYIPVDLQAAPSIVAAQFDLGFDVLALIPELTSAGNVLNDHDLDYQEIAPGVLRVVITSDSLSTLDSGSLAIIGLKVSIDALPGDYPLKLSNVVFSDAQGMEVNPAVLEDGLVTIFNESLTGIPTMTWPGYAVLTLLLFGLGWVFLRQGAQGVALSLLLGCVLLTSVVRAVTLPGDANDDGRVNVADIPVIVDQILERQTAPGDPDCNEDSRVDILDTVCASLADTDNKAPVLSPISNQFTQPDILFEITVTADDPDLPDDVLTFSLDVAPSGMAIDPSSGLISWTPTNDQVATHPVTVRVTDEEGLFATTSFNVTVTAAGENSSPHLQAPGNRVIRANELFKANLFATDPDPGDTLTFSLPTAPAGMSTGPSNGQMSWMPGNGDLGFHPVTARVTDAAGSTDEKSFTIEVVQQTIVQVTNRPPVLTLPPNTETVFGTSINLSASASDPDPGDTLTFSLAGAPSGLNINNGSGAISWTPLEAQVGAHDVTVKVSDNAGAMALGTFVIRVLDINRAPVAVDEVYQARMGVPLNVPATGVLGNDSDPNGDALTAILVDDAMPGVLSLNADGSFDYLLEPPDRTTPVELELLCDNSRRSSEGSPSAVDSRYQTNATPVVGDVDGDGDIEIVGSTGLSGASFLAELWIMNAADCSEELETGATVEAAGGFSSNTQFGLHDIDGDGDLEIIGTRTRFPVDEGGFPDDQHLIALHHDGTFAWPGNGASETSTILAANTNTFQYRHAGPTFADLDADGTVEIVMPFDIGSGFAAFTGVVVYNVEDGSIAWEFVSDFRQGIGGDQAVAYVVDLDLDGTMEVIIHNSVVDHLGQLEFELPSEPSAGTFTAGHLTLGIGNFDDDPFPELIGRDQRFLYLFEHDGTLTWKQAKRNNSEGQIAVADFDGDGEAEWAHVTCGDFGFGCEPYFLAVYESDGSLLWSHESEPDFHLPQLLDGSVNLTAFDANRDGAFDIVFRNDKADVETLFIFDGRDGSILTSVPARKFSGQQRFITIADVDGDGHAELITSYTGGIAGQTEVWTGSAANPLPAAPAYRHQWIFHEAYVNDDLTIPPNPVPHWLQPGRNGYHMITPEPDPLIGADDRFTYVAKDGDLNSNEATVTLDILPAGNPPIFLTEPDALTPRGFPYVYEPIVVDPDLGDIVTFSLSAGPAGMTIDTATGAIRWHPPINGSFNVSILALDTIGFATAQTWVLEVGDPVVVPDVIGQPELTAKASLNAENLVVGKIRRTTHPSIPAGSVFEQAPPAGAVAEFGGAVDLWISLGPAPEDIDNDGDGFSENEGDCNDADDSIFPGAADAEGDGIDQDCDGIDGNLILSEILVQPGTATVLTNEVVKLSATGIFEDGTSQNLTGIVTWSDGPRFSSASPGVYLVSATRGSLSGSAEITVVNRINGDITPPIAEINVPVNDTMVTEPVMVVGTATDANLLRYELAYAPAGETQFTVLATGSTSVNDDELGRFDPTLLLNDLYTLRLTVFDTAGNQTVEERLVQVAKNLKVGAFSLSFLDLEIPVTGISIRVNRTYDSRDRSKGDFGYGWNLDVQTLGLRANRVLGSGWEVQKSGLVYLLQPTDEHRVSITLPNGKVEEFDLAIEPTVSPLIPFPPLVNLAKYVAHSGTFGKLESLANNNLSILDAQPGEVELLDDVTNSVYNPDLFRYTAADGTMIIISADDGIREIRQPDGNVLSITPGGITHSSGKSIQFIRDQLGRIVELVDANGASQFYAYDGNGDLRTHTDNENFVTRFDYNLNHGLLRITDPLGRVVTRNEFDADGRLISTTNANGDTVVFSHDLDARQEIITDVNGAVSVVEYDQEGNILRVTDPLGGVTTHSYDSNGKQTSTTNAEGETTTRTFDNRGNKLSETNALGETTEFTYGTFDRLISVTDSLNRVTRFEYNSVGKLLRQINALGQIQEASSYDAAGNLASRTNAAGNSRLYAHDAFGNLTEETDARGYQTLWTYDDNGNLETEVDRLGAAVETQLDVRGKIQQATNSLGSVSSFSWGPSGALLSQTSAEGLSDSIVFNALGQQTSYTNRAGEIETRAYDSRGNLTSVTDANGHVISYSYDALSRRIGSTSRDGGVRQFAYDAVGRLLQETDPRGNTTRYEYDDAGRNTLIVNALNEQTQFAYDTGGNLVRKTDAKGNVFEYEYDELDRRTLERLPDSTTVRYGYDANNNLISETDPSDRTTLYGYDANDNLVSVESPGGEVTQFAYNADDKLIVQIDSRGNETRFEYDATGQLLRKTYPDGTSESFAYDADGNVSTSVDASGNITTNTYDAAGRLLSRVLADFSSETFTYTPTGQVKSSTNGLGTVQFEYDNDDRPTRKTNPDGSFITYAYDLNGNLTEQGIGLPGESTRTTLYSYDELNRISTVVDPDGRITTYSYDPIGNLEAILYPNGVLSVFEYDARSRLVQLTHENASVVFERYTYTVNDAGDRTRVEALDSSFVDYEYDQERRLTRESHFNAAAIKIYEQSYSYDAVGNRKSRIDLLGSETLYSYNEADQLLSAGSSMFSYNANGSRVARLDGPDLTRYSFSLKNELAAVDKDSDRIEFAYDAQGERVARRVNDTETRFLVDGNSPTGFSQTLAEYSDALGEIAEYTFGHQLIGQNRSGSARFHHRDGQYNVRLLTDESGNITSSYRYDAFGQKLGQTGSDLNPYQFASERWGDEEELIYLRARYYDPATGRFISRDPFEGRLRDSVTLHRYLYANSNPVSFRDPSGEFSVPTLSELSFVGFLTGAIVSGTIAAIGGKSAGAIVTDALIGGVFGAIGGPLGNGIGLAFKESKVLVALVRNPAVQRFAVRFVAAIPVTILNAAEDFSKALVNGDAYKSGFLRSWIEVTFLNFVFNTILGPTSVEAQDVKNIVRVSGVRNGNTFNIFKEPVMKLIPTGQTVLKFVANESDETLEFLSAFLWEFTKLLNDELPRYIGRND